MLSKGIRAMAMSHWGVLPKGFCTSGDPGSYKKGLHDIMEDSLREKYFSKPEFDFDEFQHIVQNPVLETEGEERDQMDHTVSILKQYSESIMNTASEFQTKDERENLEYGKKLSSIFESLDPHDYRATSQKLIDYLKANRKYSPDSNNSDGEMSTKEKYQRFDMHNKNFFRREDIHSQALNADRAIDAEGQSIKRFLESLPENMIEKMKKGTGLPNIDNEENDEPLTNNGGESYVEYAIDPDDTEMDEYDDEWDAENGNMTYETPFKGGRLSPKARMEIYKLHKEGWSVRELSQRFGIFPVRVKAVLWLENYFMEEILPHIDLETVRLALEREYMSTEVTPYQDYGIDFKDMVESDQGMESFQFGNTGPTRKSTLKKGLEMEKQKREKNKKRDIVSEGYMGDGNKAYLYRSLIVYRGKGRERVNSMFTRVLHESEEAWKLPKRVQRRLKHGPRVASQGYGQK